MTAWSSPIIFLPGAGGGAPDLGVFRDRADNATRFEVVGYPDWRRFLSNGLSAEALIAELAEEIVVRVPQGPIRIIGMSIGGHFGYALGLRLKAMGREFAGLCAIDSFMITSSAPSAGWKARALEQGFALLRKRRFSELRQFFRSKFWRLLIRLAGGRLTLFLQSAFSARWFPSVLALDPLAEEELSMRLLVRTTAPWIASLDREPEPLNAPAILLRTALTASDDVAWRRRCPNMQIFEIPGEHHTLFEPENVRALNEIFLASTRDWNAR
jgi:thioesterase domain-containing protein